MTLASDARVICAHPNCSSEIRLQVKRDWPSDPVYAVKYREPAEKGEVKEPSAMHFCSPGCLASYFGH